MIDLHWLGVVTAVIGAFAIGYSLGKDKGLHYGHERGVELGFKMAQELESVRGRIDDLVHAGTWTPERGLIERDKGEK